MSDHEQSASSARGEEHTEKQLHVRQQETADLVEASLKIVKSSYPRLS